MKTIQPDKKALQILSKTFWSSSGWVKTYETPSDDYAYAKAASYMFDPVTISHDEIVRWLFQTFEQVRQEEVTDAFIASLSSHRLELRSALGSFAIARNFPDHKYTEDYFRCAVCGGYGSERQEENLSILNFERYKWGGARHLDPLYAAFDLDLFAITEKIKPTDKDWDVFRQIISVASNLDAGARVRDFEKSLAKVIKSNKSEREVLIQILSYCGIFQPKDRIGFFDSFVANIDRAIPPVNKIDWHYPVCWWRGADGINQQALEYFFPLLKI